MDDIDLPPFVLAERDGLLKEIYTAFSGVSREGGVSWGEASVIDMRGSPEECEAARARDADTCWQDLLDDPDWNPEAGIGGWSFLDAIGFRYYLPAAIILSIRQAWDCGVLFHLKFFEGELGDYRLAKWSLLNSPQRLCVKRFLQYMGVVTGCNLAGDGDGWFPALRSYWRDFSDDTIGGRES